jgi:hypothetical protein
MEREVKITPFNEDTKVTAVKQLAQLRKEVDEIVGAEELKNGFANDLLAQPRPTAKGPASESQRKWIKRMITHVQEEYAKFLADKVGYRYTPMSPVPAPTPQIPRSPNTPPKTQILRRLLTGNTITLQLEIVQLLELVDKKCGGITEEERAVIAKTREQLNAYMAQAEINSSELRELRGDQYKAQLTAPYEERVATLEGETRLAVEEKGAAEMRAIEEKSRADRLSQELSELRANLQRANEENERTRLNAEDAASEATKAKERLRELQQSVNSGDANEATRTKLDQCERRNDELLEKLAISESEVKVAMEERAKMVMTADVLETRVRTLTSKLSTIESALTETKRERVIFEEDAQRNISSLKFSMREQDEEFNALRKVMVDQSSQLEKLKEELELERATTSELQKRLNAAATTGEESEEIIFEHVDRELINQELLESSNEAEEEIDQLNNWLQTLGAIPVFRFKNDRDVLAIAEPRRALLDLFQALTPTYFDPRLFVVVAREDVAKLSLFVADVKARLRECEENLAGGGGGDATRGRVLTLGESWTALDYGRLARGLPVGSGTARITLSFAGNNGKRELDLSATAVAPITLGAQSQPEFVVSSQRVEYEFLKHRRDPDLVPARGRLTMVLSDRGATTRRATYDYAFDGKGGYDTAVAVTFADGTRMYATRVTPTLYALSLLVVPVFGNLPLIEGELAIEQK